MRPKNVRKPVATRQAPIGKQATAHLNYSVAKVMSAVNKSVSYAQATARSDTPAPVQHKAHSNTNNNKLNEIKRLKKIERSKIKLLHLNLYNDL